jgi:L-ascorbate metabolism protein UlaG (beta-lactamase superfamily)
MSAKILFCGHSAAIISSESGKRIALDPWLDGNPSCPPAQIDPGKLDYIGLTHGHSDHASNALSLAKKTGAKIFATFELGMLLIKDGLPESQYLPMNKGGTIQLETGLSVTLTQAFHSNSYTATDGQTYYAGEACGIALRLESGIVVYHAGDTALFSDMSLIGKKFRPRVALLPIGDRFTMGPEEAAQAAALIQAKEVIPIHYATFPLLSGTAEAFTQALGSHAPQSKAVILAPGREHTVTKE